MNKPILFAAAVLSAACPLAAHAQATPPAAPMLSAPAAPAAAPVTLRYKFAVGQVHRYQYDMDMNMLMLTGQSGAGVPVDMTMQMTIRQTVQSIRPTDGAATIVSQVEDMHMLRGGQETPLPEAQQAKMRQPFTQVMLPTGKILSMQMPALGGAGMPGMDFSKGMFSGTAFLPEGPVKVGDIWHGATAAPVGGTQMAFTSTLEGLAQKDGVQVATISNKQTGTINMALTKGMPVAMKMRGQVTGEATQLFDTAAGALQSAAGTADTAMTMTFGQAGAAAPAGMPRGMKMRMQMKYTMQRLSDVAATTAPAQ